MIHILQGFDPYQLTQARTSGHRATVRRKPRFRLAVPESAAIRVSPLMSAYSGPHGGHIIALISTRRSLPSLSSISAQTRDVLAHQGKLVCTSTAAGPAFEGAQISCGMRALDGAVSGVHIDGTANVVELRVIGNAKPRGICGTGLISAVAELSRRRSRCDGRLLDPDEVANERLKRRLVSRTATEVSLSRDGLVYVSQKDVRELQLAKGAIPDRIDSMLAAAGSRPISST